MWSGWRGRWVLFFFFQAEDGIRDVAVAGVQTCALPISDPGEQERIAGHHSGDEVAMACGAKRESGSGTDVIRSVLARTSRCEELRPGTGAANGGSEERERGGSGEGGAAAAGRLPGRPRSRREGY